MLFEGPIKSGKTGLLAQKFLELIKSGVSTSETLFLCENTHKKDHLVQMLKEKLTEANITGLGNIPVYTFGGIAYNSILNNWPTIDKILSKDGSKSIIIPDMTGLDTTQYILKEIIKTEDFADYFSKNNLMHQLFRRHKLLTENYLEAEEIDLKSIMINETFAPSAKETLRHLQQKTGSYRVFDYIKQIKTFLYLLSQNKINDFNNINYFFADDIDEYSYCGVYFIEYMLSKNINYFLAGDSEGTARRGYLCGYPKGYEEIKDIHKVQPQVLTSNTVLFDDAQKAFKNIKYAQKNHLKHFEHIEEMKRTQMLDKTINLIVELQQSDVAPEDIAIITPIIDENIKFNLKEFFHQKNIKYQFLSGSKSLCDDLYVFSSLTILKLIKKDWKLQPSLFEIRILLNGLLNIPVNFCRKILSDYKRMNELPQNPEIEEASSNLLYTKLLNMIDELSESDLNLYEIMLEIFTGLIAPQINENSDLENLNMTLKSLEEFQKLKRKVDENNENYLSEKDWLNMVKTKITADNPAAAAEIKENSIIIATPQKIVDLELGSKIQIWLDISSREWVKDDIGPLYNSWVFQKNSDLKEYTPEIHNQLTLERTAHLLRKLMLLCQKKIYGFSSVLDSSGNENSGYLCEYLKTKTSPIHLPLTITPREDQKPVLEYKSGNMAVPAVPGAGKTTIMLALIIKLIADNITPSEILVLTYMESAAKNFLERIKRAFPNIKDLPHISTIHGLAYKIIQDEDNYTRLGLSQEFSICDDTQRPTIINNICMKYPPADEKKLKNWTRLNTAAISKAKMSNISPDKIEETLNTNKDPDIKEFLPIYREYQETLKENNLIDYDDLLLFSVKLLEENPKILEYYQNRYKFVIEDEAQDSSGVQQRLINLISAKNNNLIRCGDINQAITSTFTNSDIKGFKKFITENPKVEMRSSQRCAKDIYELANHMMEWSMQNEYTKDAFYQMKMTGVEGQNPLSKDAVNAQILENPNEEKAWVLKEIQKCYEENPAQTFAILPRNNSQVFEWAQLIEKHGLKVICRADSIKQKKVFKFTLKLLEIIVSPWQNKIIVELMELYNELEFITFNTENIARVKALKEPFINASTLLLSGSEINQFWWDIHYWLENSVIPPEELVIKIGNHYFKDVIDKSNANLFSVLIKRYINTFSDIEPHTSIKLPEVVAHFKTLLKQDRVYGVKFFSEEDSKDNSLDGFIQIMTLHKSKGDEFDTVFIPEMSEFTFASNFEIMKKKSYNSPLLEKIEELSSNIIKTKDDKIKEQIEETLRLLYVGITRAKKKLYLSTSKIAYEYKILRKVEPTTFFKHVVEEYLKAKDTINA